MFLVLNRTEKTVGKKVLGNGFPCSCGCFDHLRDGNVECRQKLPVGPFPGPDGSSQLLSVGFGGPAPVWAVGKARESCGMGIWVVKEQLFVSPRWFLPLVSRLPVVKHHFG